MTWACLPSHTGPLAGDGGTDPKYDTFFQELVLEPGLALRQVDMKEDKREALLAMDELACVPLSFVPNATATLEMQNRVSERFHQQT